jgi:PAS domain S-box-containing protein
VSNPLKDLQTERVLRLFVDSVRDYAIFLLTPQGQVASWNPGAERIKGYAPEDIIGQHFRVFYSEKEQQDRKPEQELVVAAQVGRFEDEGWRIRKNGSRFWANVVIVALRDEGGDLIGFGKITRDLTGRRNAEARLRRVIDGVRDYAISTLDVNGIVTSWNAGAERLKQYSEAEILGEPCSRFYTPEDVADRRPQRSLAAALERGQYQDEAWLLRKDGTRFWSSIAITPIRDDDGQHIGFSEIIRDLTDRNRIMDQVQQHARDLEERIAERDRSMADLESFNYSVSHDLRAPLRAIEGFAAALHEDLPAAQSIEVREDLRQIGNAVKRMNALIDDLLDYSRVSRADMEMAEVDLHDVMGGVLQIDPAASIRTAIAPGVRVRAQRSALTQALLNLVDNALKFHKPGLPPAVDIVALRQDNTVRITVTDDGIGIAPEHHERIFQIFQRLHTASAYPGTGIGLALVKRIVERFGGAVGVESEAGKGSTFWIDVPAA